MRRITTCVALALTVYTSAQAQTYPTKAIRMVVPFSPGGNVDINARATAPGLSEALGQTIVVDNRAGAGGMIGGEIVVKSPPDGYTLAMASNSVYSIAPVVFAKPLYNPLRDFAAVGGVSNVPLALVVHPSIPAKTFKEFVALVKSRPGQMNMATAGQGTSNHLIAEMLQMAAGIRMTAVPYKGSGPALIDLLGGQVDSHVDQLTSSAGYIRNGKIRALAVTTEKRSPMLPEVPTLAEQGLKGFDATTIVGVLAPAATPKDILDRLNTALVKVLAQKNVQDRFAGLGATTWPTTPAAFADYIKVDYAKMQKVVKDAHIAQE